MNRADYLERVASRLRFLNDDERREVLSDMEELYDGLASSGLSDAEVQTRIGSPEAVAGEYRLEAQLDRVDRSPGAASGLRIGLAALTGRFARGVAFQLVGLVWLCLAIVALGIVLSGIAGLLLAAAAATGFEPVVTTLAVPGIPAASGVLMGVAFALAAASVLLANRLVIRALSRLMRERLRRSSGRSGAPRPANRGGRPARRIDTWRAVAWTGGAAVLVAAIAAVVMLLVPAPQFPFEVDRFEALELSDATAIGIRAVKVDVRFAVGAEPSVRLVGDFRRTFAQSVDLWITSDGPTVLIEAVYIEGLSWGVNRRPVLTVTLPDDPARLSSVTVWVPETADVDPTALPSELRALVRTEGR